MIESDGESHEEFKSLFKEITKEISSDTPAEEYVDFNAKSRSNGSFDNSDQVAWKQASLQAIIEEYVCGEKSGDYGKDDDVMEAIEIISDEEESPIEIPHR